MSLTGMEHLADGINLYTRLYEKLYKMSYKKITTRDVYMIHLSYCKHACSAVGLLSLTAIF